MPDLDRLVVQGDGLETVAAINFDRLFPREGGRVSLPRDRAPSIVPSSMRRWEKDLDSA